jgi:hypothetical protein
MIKMTKCFICEKVINDKKRYYVKSIILSDRSEYPACLVCFKKAEREQRIQGGRFIITVIFIIFFALITKYNII